MAYVLLYFFSDAGPLVVGTLLALAAYAGVHACPTENSVRPLKLPSLPRSRPACPLLCIGVCDGSEYWILCFCECLHMREAAPAMSEL